MEISDREVARRFDAALRALGHEQCETEHAAKLMDMLRMMTVAAAMAMQPDKRLDADMPGRKRETVSLNVLIHRDMMDSIRSFAAENPNCDTIVEAVAFILGAYLGEKGYFYPPVLPRV